MKCERKNALGLAILAFFKFSNKQKCLIINLKPLFIFINVFSSTAYMTYTGHEETTVFILMRVARDRDGFMHQHPDPGGSIAHYFELDLSFHPFESGLNFANPSKRAADSQNFWRLSNTSVPASMGRFARTSLALERKAKMP